MNKPEVLSDRQRSGPAALLGGEKTVSGVAIALPNPNFAEVLSKVIGLPSEKEQAAKLVDGARDLIRNVVAVTDNLITTCVEKRTVEEFTSTRAAVFPQYFTAMRALGDLIGIIFPPSAIERLSSESLCQMESDFRNLGPATFGENLTERAMFTIWTLRKIRDAAQEIVLSSSRPEGRSNELAVQFANSAVWSRFHLDCLMKSMYVKTPLYPGIIEPIRDGLRAAVNAYAHIRQLADIINPKHEPELSQIEWTDEDEVLLLDSMRDLEQPV